MESLQFATIAELPQIRVLGRHTGRDPLTLFWTASGIELDYTGSELWVDLYADYQEVEPWISVELNGAWISRFPVQPGKSHICLFRGMTAGKSHHVRLLKDVQAMPEDPRHLLQIRGLAHDGGAFLALAAPAYRLEFVGDSITSGEGSIGAVCEEDWIGAFFSAENHYCRMTADALGAEYHVISQSGWGITAGWDNNIYHALPRYYTQVCGVAQGERNAALGAQEPYDFAAWQPDAVIINLGTNEEYAFHNPAWTDPETGVEYRLRLLPDGRPHPDDARRVADAVQAFLALVRDRNPEAQMVWCLGMLGTYTLPMIQQGMDQYQTATGDSGVHLLLLPGTTEETMGARQHPGVQSHRQAAETLTAFLRTIL